jgi:hypothetical protein
VFRPIRMLPIFVWKAAEGGAASASKITMIRGATWWLEEMVAASAASASAAISYEIMGGEPVVDADGAANAIYLVERRPKDWTGEDYLETVELPYRVDYVTADGVCDRVGDWQRFVAAKPVATVAEAQALAARLSLPGFSPGKKG